MPARQPAHSAHHQQQGQGPQQTQPQASPAPVTPAAFLWKWVGRSLLALLLVRALWFFINLPPGVQEGTGLSFAQRSAASQHRQVYYFYNEATGQVQWEDPGDVPFEEQDGRRYWLLPDGSKVYEDPGLGRYAWLEQYSPDLQRAYFFNQETRESSWERPADLSWRRIAIDDEE